MSYANRIFNWDLDKLNLFNTRWILGPLRSMVGYYECATAAATAAKTVTASWFTLREGGAMKIKMTYANTAASGVTLNINSTGAKSLYYDGAAVSASNTWEAGETIEVYYDGTRYYANNVAGGGGDGVFDLSKHNAVGGVLATYADLSAALTALNALDSKYKYGGMSFKFVLTSDNKYVQYRYMGTSTAAADFTNVANWQGVDDEPVAGSENLVQSNGVAKYIADRVFSNENAVSSLQSTLELGSISGLGTNTWTYQSSTTKLRTKQGTYLYLFKGDTIRLSDYTNAKMYVGCDGDYTKGSRGWLTADFIVPANGRYVVLLTNIEEEEVTVEGLGSRLQLKSNSLGDSAYRGVDDEPTNVSSNLITSGGVANKGMLYHFVGIGGNTYASAECGKIIAGHTYRVYPVVKEWSWGTTTANHAIWAISYMNNEETKTSLFNVTYSQRASMPDFADVTIPNDAMPGSGLFIGGRSTSGTKVYFTIEDITYPKVISDTLWDYNIVKDAVSKKLYAQNYTDNKKISQTYYLADSNACFLSDYIPCVENDVITWTYSGSGETGTGAICCYDANKESLHIGWVNQGGGTRTVTNNRTGCAYIRVTFVKETGYNPSVYINGVLVWIKEEDGKLVEIENTLNAIIPKAEKADSLDAQINNRINVSVGKQTEINADGTTTAISVAGWNTITQKIPIQFGDTLRWVIGSSKTDYNVCGFFDANDNLLKRYAATNKTETDIRQIALTSDTFANVAYVKLSYYDKLTDESDNLNPVVINGVSVFTPVFENGIEKRVEDIEAELHPSLPAYGEIGKNYAEQIPDIVDKLSYRFSNRLHFLNISDNHNTTYGYANELLDFIPAKFLINTGDLVNDKFSDSKTNTIACSISPTKPVYLVLGNHDYSHATSKQDVFDAFYGDDETEGTVNYHNVQTGGVATDKTYYSVDFATEGVKCIMLDMNEGMADADLPDAGPTTTTYGKMSQTQIEWFVAQLQDAITNNLHVCVFIHALPSREKPHVFAKIIDNFMDNNYAGLNSNGLSTTTCYRLSFLLDIVDAFINGESVTFTYNDHEYTFTFASAGAFVAWFAGHEHQDCCGWLTGHEKQFAINVCRPTPNSGGSLGTYDGDKLGVHFNYVTIDTGLKSLSIYRVGQQDTVYATQRKSFRIQYK